MKLLSRPSRLFFTVHKFIQILFCLRTTMNLLVILAFVLQVAFSKNCSDLAVQYGYPPEFHKNITTKDGYYLTLQRLPRSDNSSGVPVLFMHGIFGSSQHFLCLGPDKGLPYLLAKRGFDVWLGNTRSVAFARRHVKYNPDKDKEYWDFSLHELGIYDLPATIDYIVNQTSQTKIIYIAHSQGNMIFSIMCSELPEYCGKVKLLVGLSPVMNTFHVSSPILAPLIKQTDHIKKLLDYYGLYELNPLSYFISRYGARLCSKYIISDLCVVFFMSIFGIDVPQFSKEKMSWFIGSGFESISTKQIHHFAQMINQQKYQNYDYGSFGNLEKYGSENPPQYNLRNLHIPTALYYSKRDWLLKPSDVEKQAAKLPNVVDKYLVKNVHFTHLDFIFAKDIVPLLYKRILKLIDLYK